MGSTRLPRFARNDGDILTWGRVVRQGGLIPEEQAEVPSPSLNRWQPITGEREYALAA